MTPAQTTVLADDLHRAMLAGERPRAACDRLAAAHPDAVREDFAAALAIVGARLGTLGWRMPPAEGAA